MVIYFSQNLYSETSQTFTHSLIIKRQKFQIKILNEMKFSNYDLHFNALFVY